MWIKPEDWGNSYIWLPQNKSVCPTRVPHTDFIKCLSLHQQWPEVWIHTCISFHLQPADLHHCSSLHAPWARQGEQEIATTCSLGCWKRSKIVSPNGQTHTTFSMHHSVLPFLLFSTQIIHMLLLWPPILYHTHRGKKKKKRHFSSLAEMAHIHFK